jgi:uncharacterized protein (TIGR03000 family)
MGYYGPGGSYYASGFTYANGMAYRTINGSTIVNGGTTRESFYPAQDQQNAVNVRVIVPNPEAEIWFDNTPTQQRGTERFFVSGPVEQGNYSYSIKGRWMQNGQAVERTRTVRVQPGQPVTVDLRAEQGEALPQPNRNPNNPPPPNPQNPPNNKTVPPSP